MLKILRTAASIAAISFTAIRAEATEIVRIDTRIRSDPTEYAISFAAEQGGVGHAFIVWNKGDDVTASTLQRVTGFYASADATKFDILFGTKPGTLADDSDEIPDYKVIVLVNSDAYDRALAVEEKWRTSGEYTLGFGDCTTFVGEVGQAIGIKLPSRILAPFPIEYVRGIAEANAP